jgi:hypothetical protein
VDLGAFQHNLPDVGETLMTNDHVAWGMKISSIAERNFIDRNSLLFKVEHFNRWERYFLYTICPISIYAKRYGCLQER